MLVERNARRNERRKLEEKYDVCSHRSAPPHERHTHTFTAALEKENILWKSFDKFTTKICMRILWLANAVCERFDRTRYAALLNMNVWCVCSCEMMSHACDDIPNHECESTQKPHSLGEQNYVIEFVLTVHYLHSEAVR